MRVGLVWRLRVKLIRKRRLPELPVNNKRFWYKAALHFAASGGMPRCKENQPDRQPMAAQRLNLFSLHTGFARQLLGHRINEAPIQHPPPHEAHLHAARLPRRALLAALATLAQAPAPNPQPLAARTLVVFGDSQAEGLAVALRRAVRQVSGVKVLNRSKAGTAISQTENYDWPAAIRDYMPDPGVDTAILMFGGNDRLPMRPSPGTVIPFRSPAWEAEYRARTAAMLRSLSDKHLRVIWVSNPICREPKYSQDMAYLNAIYREMLEGDKETYLDIWAVVSDQDGHYAPYGHTLDGITARLRLDDGIHFTPSGYDIVASRVMQAVLRPTAATQPQ